MKNTLHIDQAALQALLRYDSDTGHFYWVTRGRGRRMNKPAGCIQPNGYVTINIGGHFFKAHRLAFTYVTGGTPAAEIDHANGIRHDNRWCNLREATTAENVQNIGGARANNKLGILGVSLKKNIDKFQAQISINGRNTFLGYFDTKEEAAAAHLTAKRLHHKLNRL